MQFCGSRQAAEKKAKATMLALRRRCLHLFNSSRNDHEKITGGG